MHDGCIWWQRLLAIDGMLAIEGLLAIGGLLAIEGMLAHTRAAQAFVEAVHAGDIFWHVMPF